MSFIYWECPQCTWPNKHFLTITGDRAQCRNPGCNKVTTIDAMASQTSEY